MGSQLSSVKDELGALQCSDLEDSEHFIVPCLRSGHPPPFPPGGPQQGWDMDVTKSYLVKHLMHQQAIQPQTRCIGRPVKRPEPSGAAEWLMIATYTHKASGLLQLILPQFGTRAADSWVACY